MKIIYNKYIPFKGFKIINLFGILFVRSGSIIDIWDLNHESIHTAQMKELGYVLFYILYILFWIKNLIIYLNPHLAYRMICFEREAYDNQFNYDYLRNRERLNIFKY